MYPGPSTDLARKENSQYHMAPLLSYMCNVSLESGQFAAVCKKAVVLPRLKKPTLDYMTSPRIDRSRTLAFYQS